ncbi:MAG: type IV pilus assembly protein PilM [Planctomycetes bacterium]|jgi:type IV pilus assembly protein PilM|nr:type IV pilus assembly protein PilM [Phycisphaerae bacterium]NBB94191.1 type IV pilus assembly protein PilM [Planctomycetota bacterium]
MLFHGRAKDVLPIGVDLGSSSAKLVQLRSTRNGHELAACGRVEIPLHIRRDPIGRLGFFAHRLPRLLKSGGFKGHRCVLGLPAENTFVRHVKIPNVSEKDTEAAVMRAAQRELPYPVREAVIRHVVAGEVYSDGETKREVIIVAIPMSTMEAYLEMTNRAGLEVAGVNIEPMAIVECFTSLFAGENEDDDAPVLYVDLGASSTQVVIAHGTSVVFARNMPRGGNQVYEALAEELNLSLETAHSLRQHPELMEALDGQSVEDVLARCVTPWLQAMHNEIDRCLQYHATVFRSVSSVKRVIFTGGGAQDKMLCQGIAKALKLPAQIGDPLVGLSIGKDVTIANSESGQPDLAVGVGLSLSGRQG